MTRFSHHALLAASLLFVGCDDGGDDDVNDAAASIDAAAGEYAEAASEYGDEAADKLKEAEGDLAEAADQMRAAADVDLSTLSGAELAEQVRMRLADARTAIEAGNFDAAERVMEDVAAVKAELPEAFAAPIAEVQTLLDKAQSAEESAQKVRDLGTDLPSGE